MEMPGGTMSPPGHLVSREMVRGCSEECHFSEVADNLSVVGASDVLQNHHIDVFAEESYRTVSHGCLHATGVPAERFVVRAAVVVDPTAFSRTTEWCIVIVWAGHAGSG